MVELEPRCSDGGRGCLVSASGCDSGIWGDAAGVYGGGGSDRGGLLLSRRQFMFVFMFMFLLTFNQVMTDCVF